jgi:hypothetical protein
MDKAIVTAKVENLNDLINVKQGLIPPEKVRSVEIADAAVDTGLRRFRSPGDSSANWGCNTCARGVPERAPTRGRFKHTAPFDSRFRDANGPEMFWRFPMIAPR